MSEVSNRPVVVDPERCNACEYCIEVCPADVLSMSADINDRGFNYAVVDDPDPCTRCTLCAEICPQIAIEVNER